MICSSARAVLVSSPWTILRSLFANTLCDCLHELAFWRELYWLRHAAGEGCDPAPEASAHDDMVFRMLAHVRPRSKEESIAVFRYLAESDCMDRPETNGILLNLIG